MGKSAKLTRGGNKKRVNVGRQEAKLKALQAAYEKDAKANAKKDGTSAPKASNKKLVAEKLRAQSQVSAVKMAPKPTKQQNNASAEEEAN